MCIKCIKSNNPGKEVEYIKLTPTHFSEFGESFDEVNQAIEQKYPGYLPDSIDLTLYGVYRIHEKRQAE